MDIRIVKTMESIEEAFLEERRHKTLENIKVKDICEKSRINKTTFYRHYSDVYELSNKLEDDLLEKIWSSFKEKEMLITAPKEFIIGLVRAFAKESDMIMILYDNRLDFLVDKVEKKIYMTYSNFIDSKRDKLIISFLIGGAVRLFMPANIYEVENKALLLSQIISYLPMEKLFKKDKNFDHA